MANTMYKPSHLPGIWWQEEPVTIPDSDYMIINPRPREKDPFGRDPHEAGAKLDAGKPKMDLVLKGFSRALTEVAKVGTYGAEKYTPNGWRTVPEGFERYSDAMMRHYYAESVEDRDRESELLHAAHLAWNSLARLELLLEERE